MTEIADRALGNAAPWFHLPRLPSETERHAIIIGAGVAGTALAAALARRGWRLTVIERHPAAAQGASGIPAGVVMPALEAGNSHARRWLDTAFRHTLQRFSQTSFWHGCGVLHSAAGDHKRNRTGAGFPLLDAATASEAAGLRMTHPAAWIADGGWLTPAALCHALLAAARPRLEWMPAAAAARLERDGDAWQVLDQHGRELARAPVVAICAGADAPRFRQAASLPIGAARGQLTHIAATPHSQTLRAILLGALQVLPARHGAHWIGATFDRDDGDVSVRTADHARNLAALAALTPALADMRSAAVLSGWTGIRAVTPNHLPMVGPVPDAPRFRAVFHDLGKGYPPARYPVAPYHPGLYLSAGHGARGMTSAPLAAELLAGMIAGEPPMLPLDLIQALHPARFLVRELRKARAATERPTHRNQESA